MKKLNYLFAFSVLIVITSMGFVDKDDIRSKYWIFNNKGQLIADTSLFADKKIDAYYDKGDRNREIRIYADILNRLLISQEMLDYGCETTIIVKLIMQRDSIDPYFHIIKDIYPLFDTNDICLNLQYNINKSFLVGQKIKTEYLADNYYLYLPIKTKLVAYYSPKLIPGLCKYIENGYFVLEINN